jgi:hypothetical protein
MYTPVRVQSIILDQNHSQYGGEATIGSITYTHINQTVIFPGKKNPTAKPRITNIHHYPVPQEIVYLTECPRDDFLDSGQYEECYIGPINILNNQSVNGIPTLLDENGEYYEGNYFVGDRLSKIRPLRPYEGDITFEGRYGQSIRFGSTIDNSQAEPNSWSNTGNIADPITIIRNGQLTEYDDNITLVTENINEDNSSIYLCSNQQISNFKPASTYDASYGQDIFKDNYGEEIVPNNQQLPSSIEEDISLNTADNLPAEELIKTEELSQLPSGETEVAYYDISPTENQSIESNNTDNLTSNYNVPNSQSSNLNKELG